MEERGGYYYEDGSGYRTGGGRDDVYLGRPPPRGDEQYSYRPQQQQYEELPQGGDMEYVRRRTRSPASSLNGSFSDPDREPRVSSPKRVTWKDPVEQQKSQSIRVSATVRLDTCSTFLYCICNVCCPRILFLSLDIQGYGLDVPNKFRLSYGL